MSCKPTPSSCSVNNPWQFAGGYLDATGLYKFGTRYYDPAIGRWTQQDPMAGSIGVPSTVERYPYVADNPVNMTDSRGASCDVGGAGLTIGGMASLLWGVSS